MTRRIPNVETGIVSSLTPYSLDVAEEDRARLKLAVFNLIPEDIDVKFFSKASFNKGDLKGRINFAVSSWMWRMWRLSDSAKTILIIHELQQSLHAFSNDPDLIKEMTRLTQREMSDDLLGFPENGCVRVTLDTGSEILGKAQSVMPIVRQIQSNGKSVGGRWNRILKPSLDRDLILASLCNDLARQA